MRIVHKHDSKSTHEVFAIIVDRRGKEYYLTGGTNATSIPVLERSDWKVKYIKKGFEHLKEEVKISNRYKWRKDAIYKLLPDMKSNKDAAVLLSQDRDTIS